MKWLLRSSGSVSRYEKAPFMAQFYVDCFCVLNGIFACRGDDKYSSGQEDGVLDTNADGSVVDKTSSFHSVRRG